MAGERDGVTYPQVHTMTTSRVPLLPVDEAKAAADRRACPTSHKLSSASSSVAESSATGAVSFNSLLATMLWHGTWTHGLRRLR